MAITEESRHAMHDDLIRTLGKDSAMTMMEHLPPVGWADVATKADLDHQSEMLTLRMFGIRDELRAEMAQMRTSSAVAFGELRSEMAQMGTANAVALGELREEVAGSISGLREETAQMGTGWAVAFGDFRDQIRAEQRRATRQVVLALAAGMLTMVATAVGLG